MERRHRLSHTADFERVRKEGRSWAQPLFVLSASRNGLDHSRFGFIVSRRVGSAVVRNRVKRQLREVVRRHLGEIPQGWDVVLIARAPIAGAEFSQIEQAFTEVLRRAHAWLSAPEAAAKSLSAGQPA